MLQFFFKLDSELLLLRIDRTQWQNTNILMISVPWNQRALPIPEKFPLLFSPFILFVQDLRMGTT